MKALLNNQIKAIKHLKTKKVGALFKSPGTGKTRTAVELIKQINPDYVLWFAPFKSVNPKIENTGIKTEVKKWNHFKNIDFVGIQSVISDRLYLDVTKKIKQSKNPFLVVDESLLIKNFDAIRTKRLTELSKLVEYKLILNGTPFSKDLTDLWAQMNFLSPKILKMNYVEFEKTFCEKIIIRKKGKIINEFITGYANIDYLYHLIKPFIYEAELVLDINVQHLYNSYFLDDVAKKEYQKIKEYFLCEDNLEEFNNNIFLMMVQKMQHSYSCSKNKIDLLEPIFNKHGKDKVAIYTKFIDSKEFILKHFPNAHVFSLQSESMSINLQGKFNVTVEFDKTWDWMDVDQYQHRVTRIGQEKDVYHYYFDGEIPLDKLIKENNKKKRNALNYFKKITKEELKVIL